MDFSASDLGGIDLHHHRINSNRVANKVTGLSGAGKIAEHFFHNQECRLLAQTGKTYDLHGTVPRLHDGLRA